VKLSSPAGRPPSDLRWALFFLVPNFIGFLVFVAVPVVFSLVMAFTNWDLIERAPFAFVGFNNFVSMLWGPESRDFWKFFATTVYLMLGIPVSIAGSLLLAVLLSDRLNLGNRRQHLGLTAAALGATLIGVLLCTTTPFVTVGLTLAIVAGSMSVTLVFNRVGLRTMFYLPFFTTGVAQFILWKLMFRPDSGPINASLQPMLDFISTNLQGLADLVMSLNGVPDWLREPSASGLFMWDAPGWLGSTKNLLGLSGKTGLPDWLLNPGDTAGWLGISGRLFWDNFGLGARDAIVIMGIWATVGGNNMLLYLAGLSNVPEELYEASMIDGAGRWRTFWNVSWPQLAPTTFFIVIMSVIAGLQGGFEQAQVMTNGEPSETTITLGFYIYREGFEQFRLGYASAVAWMLFLMIFVATLMNWRFGSRQINA
jgi:multiple sugar transport system permease protein